MAIRTDWQLSRLPKRGESIWMIVNGNPALRYFVETHEHGCRVAFASDLKEVYYADVPLFFASENDAIQFLIGGIISNVQDHASQLERRYQRLLEITAAHTTERDAVIALIAKRLVETRERAFDLAEGFEGSAEVVRVQVLMSLRELTADIRAGKHLEGGK